MRIKGRRDLTTLSWMMEVIGKNKYYVAVLAVVQTVLGASVVGYALFLRGLIDHAVEGDRTGFWHYAALLIGLVLFLAVLRWFKRFLEEYTKSSMENCFKSRLFHNILCRDYGHVRAVHTAEWMNRLTNDTKVAADGLTQVLPNLCEMSARLLAAVIALIAMQPKFSYIILPAGLILLMVTFLFRTRLKALHSVIQEKDGDLRIFYQERLNSQIVVRVFSREKQTEEDQKQYLGRHQNARMKRNWFSNLCNAGMSLAMNGAYILGAVYCGFGILNGTMTYGMFTAVLQLVGQVQSPFANLSGYLPQYFAMIASSERLREAETFPAEEPGRDQNYGATPVERIGLRHARFTYPAYDEGQEETAVLEDFNMEIRRGEFVALTGPSGCGKSTALKVLMALYPMEGGERYKVDEKGEHPLDGADRTLFSYVPQGNMLIHGSIREIVTFGVHTDTADEDRIREALRTACAMEFVQELEGGLDTVLGEQGSGLSEGQIQRLSIARALYSNREILVLDEATSALDGETEQQLLSNLRAARDRTVIIVTHRPAALEVADRVIEFSTGHGKERIP